MLNKIKLSLDIESYIKPKTILSLIFGFLLTAGQSVVHKETANILIQIILFFPIRFFISYLFLSFLYHFFDIRKKHPLKLSSCKVFFISFSVLIILYYIAFLALYPGIFAFDAPYQLEMYLSDTISAHHPVFHTYLIGKIIETSYSYGLTVNEGIAVYSIIQFTVTAACFSYLLKTVYRTTGSIAAWFFCLIYMGLFPTIVLQTLSVTKDSYFMAFFALSMSLIYELFKFNGNNHLKAIKDIFLIISLLAILVFRNNCILAFPFLVGFLFYYSDNRKRISKIITSVIVLFLLYKFAFVPNLVTVPTSERELLSVPAQQLVKIYNEDRNYFTEDELYIIERLCSKYDITNFVPGIADIAKASLDMEYFHEHRSIIIKIWWKTITSHPGKALEAIADLSVGSWYPFVDLTYFFNGQKMYWQVAGTTPFYISSKIPALFNYFYFFSFTDFSSPLKSIFYAIFAPATFFYIFLIMLGYAVIKKNKTFLSIYYFTLAYWMSYLFGPVVLVRYTTYLFAICPMYLVQIFSGKKVNETQDASSNN